MFIMVEITFNMVEIMFRMVEIMVDLGFYHTEHKFLPY